MTAEHWLVQQRYLGGCSEKGVVMEGVDDHARTEEDEILLLLLEAFPGIALERLASAYARASGDSNKAAEILSFEGAKELSTESLEDEFGNLVALSKTGPNQFHGNVCRWSDDMLQYKNGHGDIASTSVSQDSLSPRNHCRPLDALPGSTTAFEPCAIESNRGLNANFGCPPLQRNTGTQTGRNKSSTTEPAYTFEGTNATQKVSAVTGSVTSQRHRRTKISISDKGDFLNSRMESDGGTYSGSLRKKKKMRNRKGFGLASGEKHDDLSKQRAAEDFLHSMLGGGIDIEVVRDVLGHFAGDTDKALGSLLHFGSTSLGYNSSTDIDKNCEVNGELLATNIVHQEGVDIKTKDRAVTESFVDEEPFNMDVLKRLSETFPTVEPSFLHEVLQAADFSYWEVVKILLESGIIPPVQKVEPKLNPREVLHALFRTNLETQDESGPSNRSVTLTEPWTVVAAKPKVHRNPAVSAERCRGDGKWNEYARQRVSANEHWTMMKKYMKEAAAAFSQGDRALAGVLSERGARFRAMAQEASDRASQSIFNFKNKDIENNITIDLHSQHVTEALELLKLHLRSLSQIPSVHALIVITGEGSHSTGGRPRIKPAVFMGHI